MIDHFTSYHPFVNFVYFIFVIAFTMFFMHPILLLISFVCSIIYSVYLLGKKSVIFILSFVVPMILIMSLLNPLFSHEGATILFYMNDNPITLESIIYGVARSIMFTSVIMWFSVYNKIITSDKFIYLFGKIIPALSLILSMTLRFVTKYKHKIKEISCAQKCIGKDISSGNIISRIKNGINIVSILTTWALENSIDTADSMKSRGYGLKGRTSFSIFKIEKRDVIVLVTMLILIIAIITSAILNVNLVVYYPNFIINNTGIMSILICTAYFLLLILPVIINIKEEIKWSFLKSKI